MNQRLAIMIVFLAFALFVHPAAAVDTDGDGLLDLIDVPGFDPSATGTATFSRQGIEDLDGASSLTNVQRLWLDFNQITSIESGDFDGLSKLRWLSLHDNQIVSVESGVFDGLSALERLEIGENQITSLENGGFDGLNNLQELYLGSNQITSIKSGVFDGLSTLERLSLLDNRLTTIEDRVFAGFTNLATLDLRWNQITDLNLTGATLPNLFPCTPVILYIHNGFCVSDSISALVLDEAVLSQRSFDAIVGETLNIREVSLVGLTFSDDNPSNLSQLLSISTLDNVTVDQSLFGMYADEFNAFAAMDGNTVTVVPVPEASTAVLMLIGLVGVLAARQRVGSVR